MNEINNLLGPGGIQQRIGEIQQKLDQVLGSGFDTHLSATPSPLQGAIGGAAGDIAPYNPLGAGTGLRVSAKPELKSMIAEAARSAGVDEHLFDSLVAVESAYDPNARSRAGALGLTQLMPETASNLRVNNPLDPAQNLAGGAKYLSQLMKQFGSAPLALAAYNAGPGAVVKAGNAIPRYPETQQYVNRIMSLYNARTGR